MWPWLLDRVVPGLFVSALVAGSHLIQRRHITRTADRQTAEIKAQTGTEGRATMTIVPEPVTPSGGPRFGFTRHGLAVHARVADHHPAATPYQRFNKRVAMALTGGVGTMTCFWLFCCLSLCSLPAVLSGFSAFHGVFPDWLIRASIIALVAWVAQTLIQLVLLPALMVGQSLQNEAADARAAKTFEDVESVKDAQTVALDRLDDKTEGGIKAVLDAVNALQAQIAGKDVAS